MIKDFLQSEEWRKFQEAAGSPRWSSGEAGRRTFLISAPDFHASIIEHKLPIVGKYFYVPRGPLGEAKMDNVINLAKKEKVGWIRIDVDYKNSQYKIVKAPHDMQPKEVFMIDLRRSEEELLIRMKSKTRYNIKLAQKRGVSVQVISNFQFPISNKISNSNDKNSRDYFEEFLRLVKITAKRDGITPHSDEYYRKMFEIIPSDILKLYVAEFNDKVIAANLVVFYGDTATYLHGASDNESRNVMAPFLLQWRQIRDAKKEGCTKYDFGGVSTQGNKDWAGITRFKLGFSENTQPLEFPGSYDIVINPWKYDVYRVIQKIKSFL